MMAIVVLHSISSFGVVSNESQLSIAALTPVKFGTIAFFIISGFLLGERVDKTNPVEYFMRRVRRIFLPWAAWFLAASAVFMVAMDRRRFGSLNPPELLKMACASAWAVLINSPFWFVPNLLFCIAVLLMFRKFLYRPILGAILLAANLVYVINIYTLWFTPQHTQAMFGFVFYLWLGSYAAHEFERLSRFLARIPTSAFVLLAVLSGIGAYLESALLLAIKNPDPSNTLRFSNQIFSVCMVLMIYKIGRTTWPRFIDVRRHTFGLYLCHPIALTFIAYPLKHGHLRISKSIYAADAEGILLWIAVSSLTYASSLAVTMWLARTPSLHWTIGLAHQGTAPRLAANTLDSKPAFQSA